MRCVPSRVAGLDWLGAPTDIEARQMLAAGFRMVFGREGTRCELQFAQAVALGEGGRYGTGCYVNQNTAEQSCNTNNWGAAQCQATPPCPPGCIEATDHHANGTAYQACFQTYSSPEAGAAAFVRTLYVRFRGVLASAGSGNFDAAVSAMRQGGYFEAPLDIYQDHVRKNAALVASALGEPACASSSVITVSSSLIWVPAVGIFALGLYRWLT